MWTRIYGECNSLLGKNDWRYKDKGYELNVQKKKKRNSMLEMAMDAIDCFALYRFVCLILFWRG